MSRKSSSPHSLGDGLRDWRDEKESCTRRSEANEGAEPWDKEAAAQRVYELPVLSEPSTDYVHVGEGRCRVSSAWRLSSQTQEARMQCGSTYTVVSFIIQFGLSIPCVLLRGRRTTEDFFVVCARL